MEILEKTLNLLTERIDFCKSIIEGEQKVGIKSTQERINSFFERSKK